MDGEEASAAASGGQILALLDVAALRVAVLENLGASWTLARAWGREARVHAALRGVRDSSLVFLQQKAGGLM